MILLNHYKVYSNKGQMNLSVNEWNSIVNISKILFVSKSNLLSPNSRIFVIIESLCLEMVPITDLPCERGFSLHNDDWGNLNWVVVSLFWPQEHIGIHSLKSLSRICDHLNDWVQTAIFDIVGIISRVWFWSFKFLNTLIKEEFLIFVKRLRLFYSEVDFSLKICKINIIFSINVSILRILSLILEKPSQKMYLLLL